MGGSEASIEHPQHPYVPRDLHLPGYVLCFLSQFDTVVPYVGSSVVLVVFVWLLSGKEYGKADSRYLARDATAVVLEGITGAFVGPSCLLAVYAIASRKAYALQLSISLGQLYGFLAYFMTAYIEGSNFAASSYYYWAYFVGANSPWLVITILIVIRCWNNICAALLQVDKKMKIK